MHQLDFYFHNDCLSQQSARALAREIQQECPDWHVMIHPLSEPEAIALGFQVLPTIVMNGIPVTVGIPKKDWLLGQMKNVEA